MAWIPSKAILSTKSSALAQFHLFQKACKACKDDALHLALCLAYERKLGSSSEFAGYIQSLPRKVSLPFCWDSSWLGMQWFHGTEAWRAVQRAEQFWDSDKYLKPGYSFVRLALTQRRLRGYWDNFGEKIMEHTAIPVLFSEFCDAFTLVSSRAFIINLFHGYVLDLWLGCAWCLLLICSITQICTM